MSDLTDLNRSPTRGESSAASDLFPLIYDELRKLAAARLAQEPAGQTLQPTALVHEAYLRLMGANQETSWQNHGHFFAAAAEAMRRILIEHARRKHGPKQGGHMQRRQLDPDQIADADRSEDLIALDEALERLSGIEPRAAEVVKLRYFGGLTLEQVAATLGISPRTADADWAYARAWLITALRDDK